MTRKEKSETLKLRRQAKLKREKTASLALRFEDLRAKALIYRVNSEE